MYNLYMLGFVLDFKKLDLFVFDEIEFNFVIQMFSNEINNNLFNRYVSYFVNFNKC